MSTPTEVSSARVLIALHSNAANGAANSPPITSPATTGQVPSTASNVNDAAVASVMKNSAKLTEPMVVRGSLPEPTRVLVTTGPQPPPPTASTKPPNSPSFAAWRGSQIGRAHV